MSQQGGPRAAAGVFLGGERAASRRVHPQHLEEARRHVDGHQPLGFAAPRQGLSAVPEEGEICAQFSERLSVALEGLEDVDPEGPTAESGGADIGNPGQPIGFGKRQRPQHQRIDDAEDGGVGADAEREDDDRDQRQSPIAPESAQRVLHILAKRLESQGFAVVVVWHGGSILPDYGRLLTVS